MKHKLGLYQTYNGVPYLSLHIANYIIWKAKERKRPIRVLGLMKICFLVYCWSALLIKKRPFAEVPQQWECGPIIASIYYEFREYGRSEITAYAGNLSRIVGEMDLSRKPLIVSDEDTELIKIIDIVVDKYLACTVNRLIEITEDHQDYWPIGGDGEMNPIEDSKILLFSRYIVDNKYQQLFI